MLRWIHRVSTVLVLGIGAAHTLGTAYFYDRLSEAAIWFAGAGLSAIFVALLNLGLWPSDAPIRSRRLAAAANFLFFFWLVAGVWASPGIPALLVAGAGAAMVVTAPMLGAGGTS